MTFADMAGLSQISARCHEMRGCYPPDEQGNRIFHSDLSPLILPHPTTTIGHGHLAIASPLSGATIEGVFRYGLSSSFSCTCKCREESSSRQLAR